MEYEEYDKPFLDDLLAQLERHCQEHYRAGDNDGGHKYYLMCCKLQMELIYREQLERRQAASSL